MSTRSIGLILAALLACACASEPSTDTAGSAAEDTEGSSSNAVAAANEVVIGRDSLGVRIVESSAPLWGAAEPWRLEPTLRIGAIDAPTPYQFTAIRDAAKLSDGRLLVVDRLTRELRVFDADGRHLLSFGGAGQGPGEFQSFPSAVVLPGDTIVTFDAGSVRLTWFTSDGTVVRTETLAWELLVDAVGLVMLDEVVAFPEGSRLVIGRHAPPTSQLASSSAGGYRMFYRLVYDSVGTQDRQVAILSPNVGNAIDLGRFPESQSGVIGSPGGPGLRVTNPFHPASHYAVDPRAGQLHVTVPGKREILTYDASGQIRRIIRQGIPLSPLTSEMIEGFESAALDSARANGVAASLADLLEQMAFPDSIFPYAELHSDADGNLWVMDHVPGEPETRTFQIFDPSGAWLGAINAPTALGEILEIGTDHLLSVATDEFDVPYLQVSRLVKDPANSSAN